MAPPYANQQLLKPSFLQRLLRRQPRENAFVELNNLFAAASRIEAIRSGDVERVLARYKLKSGKSTQAELGKFYIRFLEHCLKDHHVSEAEVSGLDHLKAVLHLADRTVRTIHDEVSREVFGRAVSEALADEHLTVEEHTFLEKLSTELQLPDQAAQAIYGDAAKAVVQRRFDSAISDEWLSPDEETQLSALAQNLRVTVTHDGHTRGLLERYRLFWTIENAQIPEVGADIKLQKGEACHFTTDVEWFENRTVTRRIRYGGPTARVRIAKGLYWRMGDVGVQRITQDVLTRIDSGRLYLTNKRLVFVGERKNTTLRLNKILGFTPYTDGAEIEKESGRSPILKFDADGELFGVILSRLLADA